MDFGLSEEQTILQQSLRGYLASEVSIEKVRAIMESEDPGTGDLGTRLAAQGVQGVLIPEQWGGSTLGLLDACVVAEELGRAATPLSFHSSSVMAPLFLAAAGNDEQREQWLPAMATGERLVSVALDAKMIVDGELDGSVYFVADGQTADALVVTCKGPGGRCIYVVPTDTPGVTVHPLQTVDATRRVTEVVFDGVELDNATMMSHADAELVYQRSLQAGRIALAADALGAAERTLELAVEYAKSRRQFGRVIGSFQAVKHMCADMAAEIEPLRSLIWYAAFAWDEKREEAALLAPLVKAHAGEVAMRAVTTAVQVFGGMGFTYECDMHIWFKRAGYDRQMLGGPEKLRAEAARMSALRPG